MKLTTDKPFADPDKAARRLTQHAHAFEPVQDGRIYIEKLNGPFLFGDKGTPEEYAAGLALTIDRGWLELHDSGSREVHVRRYGLVCLMADKDSAQVRGSQSPRTLLSNISFEMRESANMLYYWRLLKCRSVGQFIVLAGDPKQPEFSLFINPTVSLCYRCGCPVAPVLRTKFCAGIDLFETTPFQHGALPSVRGRWERNRRSQHRYIPSTVR